MDESAPLYRQILDSLLGRISSGELKPGDRLPTELELEAAWSVSRITAARAIRELQQMGLVERRRGSGTFVCERTPPAAGRGAGAGFIAAIFPQIERNGVPEILAGIEAGCSSHGLLCTFHNTLNDPETEARLIERAGDQGCAGMIIYPCFAPLGNAARYREPAARGLPLAMVDHSLDFLDLPLFACDNAGSMGALTRHVLGRGHRRIAFLCHSLEDISSEQDRFRGHAGALVQAGISPDPRLLVRVGASGVAGHRPDREERDALVAAALGRLLALPEPPSCIMAVNDLLAISVVKAARARGLRVPEDVAVTGFDNIDAGDLLDIPLTTVAQPFAAIGEAAAAFVAGGVEGASVAGTGGAQGIGTGTRLMPGRLVVRASA